MLANNQTTGAAAAPTTDAPLARRESTVDVSTATLKPRTVLVALDHSLHSSYAAAWAKDNLLNPATDLVVLVNVRPIAVGHASFYEDMGQLVRDVEEENRASSHKLLQHYGYDLKRLGFQVRAISIRGDTRSDVVRKAQELNATVVVCGSRGLGTLQRAFLGSVSNYIVNHCSCPVLVIRPPADSDLVQDNRGSARAPVTESHETAMLPVDQESAPSTPLAEPSEAATMAAAKQAALATAAAHDAAAQHKPAPEQAHAMEV
ncbi:hypothetical protein H9P43_008739 [Blastocladiella emersonii ATCC 22665]|nr:hypothetical protein H9P43_008739 [Blastocladiella emersonii ATCC 22665]